MCEFATDQKMARGLQTPIRGVVVAKANILVIQLWIRDAERFRTSLRAVGLTVQLTRVDFPAALNAALSWGSFDAILFDPETPSISLEHLTHSLRERSLSTPIVLIDGTDVGKRVAAVLRARRN